MLAFGEHTDGGLSRRANSYASDFSPYERWPQQQPPLSASASAADVAYERDEFVDPLMVSDGIVNGGSKAENAELPFSTLWQMQLEREEQSHQEACDKYGKVCTVLLSYITFGLCLA